MIPTVGYWCVFFPLLTVFANVSHLLAMKTPPLLLKLSLFFDRQGINPGSVKVHLILLFDTGPRVLFAQYILPLL